MSMSDSHLPKKIHRWEQSLRSKGCLRDLKQVLQKVHLPPSTEGVLYDIDAVSAACMHLLQQEWWDDAEGKSKPCSYMSSKTEKIPPILSVRTSKGTRSFLAKLMCRIMPLEGETGRYTNAKKEFRFCAFCNTSELKDEYHFSLSCPVPSGPSKPLLLLALL